jgi:hypothetical protein
MMTQRQRQLLLIGLFALSAIGIAVALYFVFFRGFFPDEPAELVTEDIPSFADLPSADDGSPTIVIPPTITQPELEEADEIADGSITQTIELTTSDVEGVTVGSSGVSFYNPSDGRFYTMNADGEMIKMSDQQFPQAETIEWNKDADKAVIEFPDGSNVVYNFDTETQVTLPSHWEDFDFSATTDEIIAKSIGIDPDNRWLVVSNANGTNIQAIHALGDNANKVDVSWSPNNQVIAFADTATGTTGAFDRKTILPVGMNDENLPGLTVEGIGFDSIWSPNGKQILYSVSGDYSDYKPLLWIVDGTATTMGENRKSLGVNTWVDKCTFYSNTTIYCAVPSGLPANAGIQRAAYNTLPDTLYKIDLTSGRTSLIAIPDSSTPMYDLFVADNESAIYFTNGYTGNLEMIRLK